jgi:hypothetical protein
VAGALEAIRSKKSREQIKIERLLPFVPVINEALDNGWKWSPIVTLIRKSGGPSLSKKDAETLYEQIKHQRLPGNADGAAEDAPVSVNTPPNAPQAGAKEEVAE